MDCGLEVGEGVRTTLKFSNQTNTPFVVSYRNVYMVGIG